MSANQVHAKAEEQIFPDVPGGTVYFQVMVGDEVLRDLPDETIEIAKRALEERMREWLVTPKRSS